LAPTHTGPLRNKAPDTIEGFKNLFKLNNTKGNQRLREKKRKEAEEVEYY